MSNDYFNHNTTLARLTLARASLLNALFAGIAEGFDKLPSPTDLYSGTTNYAVDSGVVDAYAITLPNVDVYADGLKVRVKIGNTNTGAATLNVSGLGARAIKRADRTDVASGDLRAEETHEFIYSASTFVLTTATQSDISAAQQAKADAEAALDEFTDVYLGEKSSAPATDNDGDALQTGALYFDTTDGAIKVYDGSSWTPVLTRETGDARYHRFGGQDVGAVNLLKNNTGQFMSLGETAPAADLAFAYHGANGAILIIAAAPAGTWRCLSGSDEGGLGLYERII